MPIFFKVSVKQFEIDKINRIRLRHHFEDKKIWNCQYLGNEIKYGAEIWYVKLTYDADFDSCPNI